MVSTSRFHPFYFFFAVRRSEYCSCQHFPGAWGSKVKPVHVECALRTGERSVNELVEVVDIGQPGVSRQLGILEEARFVRVRPDGRRRLYALRPERFRELDDWTRRYRDLWEARLDRLAGELDRRRMARAKDKGRRA